MINLNDDTCIDIFITFPFPTILSYPYSHETVTPKLKIRLT